MFAIEMSFDLMTHISLTQNEVSDLLLDKSVLLEF
jgi:hypothetical protein